MLKNIVGALALTVFVFVAVNVLSDLAFPPNTPATSVAQKAPAPAQEMAEAEVEPVSAPEPVVETQPDPTPEPSPEPVVEASPEPAPEPVVEAAAEVAAAVTGDLDKGKKTFRRKCMTCHTYIRNGRNLTGPNLWNVVGRDKGTIKGFRYSKTLSVMGGTWTDEDLLSFIASPRKFVTDTKMAFAGLKKEQDRQNVLAFLKTLKD